MKQLRRIQRKNRAPLFLVLILIVAGLFSWSAILPEKSQVDNQTLEALEVMGPKTVEVILERVYLDGEKSEERIEETIWSMEDFWALYRDWNLINQNEEEIIFRQEVEDISPLLKVNGYFGLTEEGILTIYEGEPNNRQIIHTFFQLDTSKLKSQLHSELVRGIPVKDLNHYQEVLQVFGQYKAKPI